MKNIEKLIELAKQHGISVTEGEKNIINKGKCKIFLFDKGNEMKTSYLESVIESIEPEDIDNFFYNHLLLTFNNERAEMISKAPLKELTDLMNYGEVMPCAVNTEANADYLEELVHRDTMDLSIVYRLVLGIDQGMQSILVTNHMLNQTGITEEQLFARAKEYVIKHRTVQSLCEVMRGMGADIDSLLSGVDMASEDFLLVVSYEHKINGGGILAMAAEDAEILGDLCENYPMVVIPSSIHELLLNKREETLDDLGFFTKSVEEVNSYQVDMEERLSNSIYYLNQNTGKIELLHKGRPLSCCNRSVEAV